MTNNWLISHPKSGSNWIRYCVEYLTGKPTQGQNKRLENGNDGPPENWVLRRSHHVPKELDKDSKVVILLRNYKELICRPGMEQFGDVIDAYEDFFNFAEETECKTHIVYYEDISDIYQVFELFSFWGLWLPAHKHKDFLENDMGHFNNSLDIGNEHFTDGRTPIKHSEMLTREQRHAIDLEFITRLKWNYKYLIRYYD